MINRPPVGFIVEGDGEFHCYPSLFAKIVQTSGFKIPIVNAGGCGSIVRRLSDQLTDLLMVDSPANVIVTVDLKDVIKQNLAKDESDLIKILQSEVSKWSVIAKNDQRLQPLPKRIVCLAQIQKFETWIISDLQGLKNSSIVKNDAEEIHNAELILEPSSWLKEHLTSQNSLKNPKFARSVISAVSPQIMRKHSLSFDRFFENCNSMYLDWSSDINTLISEP